MQGRPSININIQGPVNIATQVDHQASSSSILQSPQFHRKIVRSHSDFPISPFDLSMTHPHVETSDKYRTYKWITNLSLPWDEMNRYCTISDLMFFDMVFLFVSLDLMYPNFVGIG